MRLETLNTEFCKVNPTGSKVWELRKGLYAVVYSDGGKVYEYRAKSVYALAERFGLIPDSEVDYFAEANRAIIALENGEEFTSVGALGDTIRYIAPALKFSYTVGRDAFDRPTFTFIAQ